MQGCPGRTHGCLSSSKCSLHQLSSRPTWEVSAIAAPISQFLESRDLAKLRRSEERRQGRVHGTEGNPNSWGSAGTCQMQPPPCCARRVPRWHTAVWNP